MKRRIVLSAFIVATTTMVFAQESLPANGVAGKCYARTLMPDKYETVEEQVIDKPASVKYETIAEKTKVVYDSVLVKAATVKVETIPAIYELVMEDSLVSAATQKWVKIGSDPNCLSKNPADCEVVNLKEVPAVYKKVSRKIERVPASTKETPVAAVYNVNKRTVILEPARTDKIDIPATYKTATVKKLVSKGGFTDWQEVLCEVTPGKVKAIQAALSANGYSGGADGVWDDATKDALLRYQQDKGLPMGNLNIATLSKLGVK